MTAIGYRGSRKCGDKRALPGSYSSLSFYKAFTDLGLKAKIFLV